MGIGECISILSNKDALLEILFNFFFFRKEKLNRELLMNNSENNGDYLPMKFSCAVAFTESFLGCRVSWVIFQ